MEFLSLFAKKLDGKISYLKTNLFSSSESLSHKIKEQKINHSDREMKFSQ